MISPSSSFLLDSNCFISSSQSLILLKDYVDTVLLKHLHTPVYLSIRSQNGLEKKLLLLILPLISNNPDRSDSSILSLLLIMQQILEKSSLSPINNINRKFTEVIKNEKN